MDLVDPHPQDLYEVGTLSEVLNVTPFANGTTRIVLKGIQRAKGASLTEGKSHLTAAATVLSPAIRRRRVNLMPDREPMGRVRREKDDSVAAIDNESAVPPHLVRLPFRGNRGTLQN